MPVASGISVFDVAEPHYRIKCICLELLQKLCSAIYLYFELEKEF